jgi:membrane complex biogenesis BtpA family protein
MNSPVGRIIGMLHMPALPGSPRNEFNLSAVIDRVLKDADALVSGGVDALLLENFGDIPFYPDRVPPHTVAFMTAAGGEVKRAYGRPLGINVLRNDAAAAIAVACACGAEFIRVNVHTSARLTDQGLIEGKAHDTLRYRKLLGSDVAIFADVDVKHSAPLADIRLEDEVEDTVLRGCADAVIVTGSATGKPASPEDLKAAKQASRGVPVYAGSGVDGETAAAVLAIADGAIVGTAFKRAGAVQRERVKAFMDLVGRLPALR